MKQGSFLMLIEFLLPLTAITNQLISFPISFNPIHCDIKFKAQIGEGHLELVYKVDLRSAYSIIFRSGSFDQERSSTMRIVSAEKGIEVKGHGMVYGYYSADFIHIHPLFSNISFAFLYVSNKDDISDTIDTSTSYFTFAKTNASLPYLLAKSGVVKERVFHFTNDSITIGGLNETVVALSQRRGKCADVKDETHWACNIAKISIGAKISSNRTESPQIELNDTLVFDSFAYEIIAPYNLVPFFKQEYFRDDYHKACSVSEDYSEMRIVCDRAYMRLLRPLMFHLGTVAFVLTGNFLMETTKDAPRLDFRICFRKNQNYWSFDNRLIMKYSIAFNAEDSTVSFFSNRTDDLIDLQDAGSSSLMQRMMLMALCNVITCGGFLLFFIEFKLIKNERVAQKAIINHMR